MLSRVCGTPGLTGCVSVIEKRTCARAQLAALQRGDDRDAGPPVAGQPQARGARARARDAQLPDAVERAGEADVARAACEARPAVGKRTFVAVTSSPSPSQRAIEPPRARASASRTA